MFITLMSLCLIELVIGFTGLYYVSKYKDVDFKKDGGVTCYNLVLYAHYTDIFSGLLGLSVVAVWYMWYTWYKKNTVEQNVTSGTIVRKRDDVLQSFIFAHFFKYYVILWTLLSFQNTLDEYDAIIKTAPELWALVIIHDIIAIVITSLVSFLLITLFVMKISNCIGYKKSYKIIESLKATQNEQNV